MLRGSVLLCSGATGRKDPRHVLLSHLTLSTGHLEVTARAQAPASVVAECFRLFEAGGGPLPGHLRAFRVSHLLMVPGESASFFLSRESAKLAWNIICTSEEGAGHLWPHLAELTSARRPVVPWVCTHFVDDPQAQALVGDEELTEFQRCAAWAALDLFAAPER